MKNLKPNPLRQSWASETTNKISINDLTRGKGILYKGPIVSEQLNGMGNDIYNSVIYNQFSGGLYQPILTYHKSQFCTIYWKKSFSTQAKILRCICINDNEGKGIFAIPPIKGANVTTENGIDLYNGGELDTAYWGFYNEAPISTFKIDVPFNSQTTDELKVFSLFSIPFSITLTEEEYQVSPIQKIVEANVVCLVEKTNISGVDAGYYSFPMTIRGVYTLSRWKDPDTNNIVSGYKLNPDFPHLEFNYGQVNWAENLPFYPVKPGTENTQPWLYYGMPFGLAFTTEKLDLSTGSEIFFKCYSRGLNSMRIEGTGNIEFYTQDFSSIGVYLPFIPVRSYGGVNSFDKIGSLIPFHYTYLSSTNENIGNDWSRMGQLSLIGISNLVSSGRISLDYDEGGLWFSLYRYLSKYPLESIKENLLKIKDQFPRIYDGDVAHMVGNVQGDAIRNLRTSGMWYAVLGTPLDKINLGVITGRSYADAAVSSSYKGATYNIDFSKGTDNLPTTDPITGENRPKAIWVDYRLQCF